MNPKTREVGGGAATGLSDDLIGAFRSLIAGNYGGQPGPGQRYDAANPVGSTNDFLGAITDILSPGGGRAGAGLTATIGRQSARDVADLRARYGATGGQAFGTPAAYAESQYRAEAAPRAATAVSQAQLSALMPLLALMAQLSGKGLSQRSTVIEPPAALSWLQGLGGAATGAGNLLTGLAA